MRTRLTLLAAAAALALTGAAQAQQDGWNDDTWQQRDWESGTTAGDRDDAGWSDDRYDRGDDMGEDGAMQMNAFSTRELQRSLRGAGYDPGGIDGEMGPGTRAAIRAFQRDNDLPVTGRPSRALFAALAQTNQGTAYENQQPYDRDRSAGRADIDGDLVADVQYALRDQGYRIGQIDGEMDAETRAAIRAFQRETGMQVTGQPSRDLLTALQEEQRYAAGPTRNDARAQSDPRYGVDRYPEETSYDRQNYGELVRRTEAELQNRGYRTGPVDQRLEPQSARAIQTYQQQRGMEPTGEPTVALLDDIRRSDVTAPPPSAEELATGIIGSIFSGSGEQEQGSQ